MSDLEMILETASPKKSRKPPLKLGKKYRVEVPYPAHGRGTKATFQFKEIKTMTLIDFRDGGVVIAQERGWVPENYKGTEPDYSHKLMTGQVTWKRGVRLRRIKRSWIKEEVFD